MYPDLADTIALLTRTPAALNALLRDLPESWTHRNEGEHTWSPYEVIGHLIHGEHTDWIPRAKMILEFGESTAFEPFDREAFKRQGKDKLLPELLDDFARLRSENLKELRNLHLQPEDLDSRGTHPTFGTVTLSQLLASWAVHDLTHLHQIARVMAHQYRAAVGPWTRFMGVMQCVGHSS